MAEALSQSDIESLLSEMNGAAKPEAAQAPSRLRAQDGVAPSLSVGLRSSQHSEAKVLLPLSRRRAAALTGRDSTMAYEPYDFRRSDKLSKEHVRSIQVIHENFARLFTSSISGYLRATMQVDLVSIEQVPYEEYIRSISSSLINVLNVTPVTGQAMLDFDLRMLFAMIDRLLGGVGEGQIKQGKDLTDVEKVLSRSIVRKALADLAIAWNEVLPLEFSIASVESSAQFLQIVPNNDTIVLILFDVGLGDQQGAMCLAIPYMLLKPYSQRLNAQHWFASAKKTSQLLAPKMAARLRELTSVPCIARLGTSQITVEAVTELEVGQILPLRVAQGNAEDALASGSLASVDLLIGDKPKFRGHIGLRGGKRLAVQIDDVIIPPPGLEIHKEAPATYEDEDSAR